MENTQRLDKYLANLGVASRRNIKTLLKEQVLTVNDKRVRESGTRIDPQKDAICLNGKAIKPPKLVYFLLNKPLGIISTTSDEFGREDVTSLIPSKERIYPVGRLDKDTSGLIILTNDGELANLLTHPRYHVDKTYLLSITGRITNDQMAAFRNGIILDDGITAPAAVKILQETNTTSSVIVTIHEGKNRQIRRMCKEVRIDLLALERIQFGPLTLGNLKSGQYRELTPKEVQVLREAAKKM